MKIAKIARWTMVMVLLILLVQFPRNESSGDASDAWAAYSQSLSDLYHRMTTLSLGTTVDGRPISGMVASGVWTSLIVVLIGLLFVVVVGVGKGTYDGLRTNNSGPGTAISGTIQSIAESVPDFFLIFSIELFGFYLNRHGLKVYFVGERQQFFSGTVVPAMVNALVPTMYMARMVRLTVAEQLGQQYLVTARAKGLRPRRIVLRHILPNALHTVIVALLPVMGMLLSNLVMVEYLFYRQGIMGGIFYAMGYVSGQHHAFDSPLVTVYLLSAVVLFVISWFAIRLIIASIGYRGQSNPYANAFTVRTTSHRMPWQVVLGSAMMLVLLLAGLLANQLLHLPDPNALDPFDMSGEYWMPPFPPSLKHWLGTDILGRDLLSRAVHDTLPTFGWILLTVTIVLAISVLLALLSSVRRSRFIRFVIDTWNAYVTLVPGVVAALLILNIPQLHGLGYKELGIPGTLSMNKLPIVSIWGPSHAVLFIGVLCFVECGRVSHQFQSMLDEARNKSYMEAAEISGNSTLTKFLIYYVRPLWNAVMEQSVIGFSRVLLLVSTLGFFGLAIAQANAYDGQTGQAYLVATSNDWGGLFAENARDFLGQVWVMFAPALMVAWTVISMNIILAGLRRWLQQEPDFKEKPNGSLAFRLVSAASKLRRVPRDVNIPSHRGSSLSD